MSTLQAKLTTQGTTYDLTDFTFTWPLNGAITWSASIPEIIALDFAEDTLFTLFVSAADYDWYSPPLVASVRTSEKGIGVGDRTQISGVDKWSYLASKADIDMPAFLSMDAADIVGQLAAHVGITVEGAPSYKVLEYNAQGGKAIEHIARLFRDGGYGYKVLLSKIVAFPLKGYSSPGYGDNFIKVVRETYDATQRITSLKIIKTSKIQTRYQFVFEETGFQTFNLTAPLISPIVRDLSTSGYVDEIAFFNSAGVQVGNTILTHSHTGVVYPPGHGSGGIVSGSCVVYPNPGSTADIYSVLVVEGTPYGQDLTGIDLSFSVSYDTGTTPARPASDYIDGTIMPSEEHADGIKEALFWDKNKKSHTMNFTCDDPIMIFEPGEAIPYGGNTARIESVNLSKNGISLECCVV